MKYTDEVIRWMAGHPDCINSYEIEGFLRGFRKAEELLTSYVDTLNEKLKFIDNKQISEIDMKHQIQQIDKRLAVDYSLAEKLNEVIFEVNNLKKRCM